MIMFLMKSRWPGASGTYKRSPKENAPSMKRTNDSDHVLGGLEFPESDIDGDTTLTLGLQLVEHPGILEGALAQFGGFLRFTVSIVSRYFFDNIQVR